MQNEFIFSKKWCEIVFEKRNHAYGAYVLRKRQPDNIIAGWITTFLAFGFLFAGFIYLNNRAVEKIKEKVFPTTSTVIEYQFDQSKNEIQTYKKVEPPSSAPKAAGLYIVTDSITSDVDTASSQPVAVNNGRTGDGKSDTLSTDPPLAAGSSGTGTGKTEPVLIAALMPEFPGGESAMLAFMRKNVVYPDEYLRMGKSARVYIQFVIDTNGQVTEIGTLKGEDGYPLFEESAIHAAAKMPHWKPGEQGGMKVPVLYKLPVSFTSK